MKSLLLSAAAAASMMSMSSSVRAAAFTAGNLVVYRYGDGTAPLTNAGNAVFLDEYAPTGTLVQSISTGLYADVIQYVPGEGNMTRSGDGRYLSVPGFSTNGATGSDIINSATTTNPRVTALVDANGNIDRSTAPTDYAKVGLPYSSYTPNGTDVYMVSSSSGSNGGNLRYTTKGGTTTTAIATGTTFRYLNSANGQLYATQNSGAKRIVTVGAGIPTSGTATTTNLPGLTSTNSPSPYAFQFADLNADVAGVDTLYVADNAVNSSYSNFGGGIQKFCLDNGTWTFKGSVSAAGVRGLDISVINPLNALLPTVNLFGTYGSVGAAGGGTLYGFVDTTGYDGTLSGSALTLATASANESFAGLAPTPTPEPTSLAVVALSAGVLLRRRRTQVL